MAEKHRQEAQGQEGPRSTEQEKPARTTAVQDLGQILHRQIAEALRPIMAQAGEQVAHSMRQRLGQTQHDRTEQRQTPQDRTEQKQTPQEHDHELERETRPAPGRSQGEANQLPRDRQRERRGAEVEDQPKQAPRQQRATYAQVMTTVAQPGMVLNVDDTVKLWQEHLSDVFKDAEGFRGVFVLGNAGSSTGLTITLWDNEQAALTSRTLEQVVASIRDSVLGAPKIEGYQVIVSL